MLMKKIISLNASSETALECEVLNETGVHVRPSGMIVNVMQKYKECTFCFKVDGTDNVFAKKFSVMNVLVMGLMQGTVVSLEVKGPNSELAAQEIRDLFATGFGEIEQVTPPVSITENTATKPKVEVTAYKEEFKVNLAKGLHFRPLGQINLVATKHYPSANLKLIVDGQEVDAQSFASLMSACTSKGNKITVSAEGLYAKEAVEMVGSILSDSEIGLSTKISEGLQEASSGVVYSGNILYYERVRLKDVILVGKPIDNNRVIGALNKFALETVPEAMKSTDASSEEITNLMFLQDFFTSDYTIVRDTETGNTRKSSLFENAGMLEKYPGLREKSLLNFLQSYADKEDVDVRELMRDIIAEFANSDLYKRMSIVYERMLNQIGDVFLDIFDQSGADIYNDYFEKFNELSKQEELVTIHADNIPEGLLKRIIADGIKEKIKAIHFEENTNGIGHLGIYLKSIGVSVVTSSKKQYVTSMYTDTRAVRISLENMGLESKESKDSMVYALKDCPFIVLETSNHEFVDIGTITTEALFEYINSGAQLIGNKSLLQQWISNGLDKKPEASLNALSSYLNSQPSRVLNIANVNQIKTWCMLQQTEHADYERVLKGLASEAKFMDDTPQNPKPITLSDSIVSTIQIMDEESKRAIGLTRLESMIINDYLGKWESEFNGAYDSLEFMNVFIRDVSVIIEMIIKKDPNAVIRLLDTAPDKLLPFLKIANANQRGMEVIKQNEAIYKAVLRVCISKGVNKVLVPMVGKSDDITYVRKLMTEALEEMGDLNGYPNYKVNMEKMKVGAMVETPESVVNLKGLVEAADFFSIGGNDLKHLMFGEARFGKSNVASVKVQNYNVLELVTLSNIIDSVKKSGKEIGYCGDLHSKYGYLFAYLLFGFNVDYVVVPDSSLVKTVGNLTKLKLSDVEAIKEKMRNNQEINQLKDFIFQVIEPVLGEVDRHVDLFSQEMGLYISILMRKDKSDTLTKSAYDTFMQSADEAMTEIMAEYVR